MHSFVVLMPSRAVTEGCRAFSTGSYAETIDRCAHAAHRAANLTESGEKCCLKSDTGSQQRRKQEKDTRFPLSYYFQMSTSGITLCYSQKCKQFLEEAPAGPHITVKEMCDLDWIFQYYYYYYLITTKNATNTKKECTSFQHKALELYWFCINSRKTSLTCSNPSFCNTMRF